MKRIEETFKTELDEATGATWQREYRVSPRRRWRFDLALPKLKLAVEIDGRSHGRAKQQVSDCEKNNYAVAHGWRVLHYPASRVLTKVRLPLIIEQIRRVMFGVADEDLDSEILSEKAA